MSDGMRPFFSYYGAKWKAFAHYPEPRHRTIIEPFAGAAGYSVRYFTRKVKLCDKNPVVAGLWKYLINATSREIRRLPILEAEQSVDDLKVCQEAKSLIGYWIKHGVPTPAKRMSPWAKENPVAFWSARQRNRIAHQIEYIRHWEIYEGSYEDLTNEEATWYVDPPYQKPNEGGHYKHGSKSIDFDHLGAWCQTREGQTIVCESSTADWLPFRFLLSSQRSGGWGDTAKAQNASDDPKPSVRSFDEMIWTNHWEDLPWLTQTHSQR